MRVRLFSLRHVPQDEADDIRRLLDEHDIDFYETHAGGWGISVPAIWLYDDRFRPQAEALIESYQQQRTRQARQAYEELRQAGQHRTWRDTCREHPWQAVLLLLMIVFVLYVSLSPFIHFLQ